MDEGRDNRGHRGGGLIEASVLVAVIGAIEAITVAIVGGLIARSNKKAEEIESARAERDDLREKRDACLYDLIFATAVGTEVLLQQAHGEKMNGNVEDALTSIRSAKSECNHEFNKQVAKG